MQILPRKIFIMITLLKWVTGKFHFNGLMEELANRLEFMERNQESLILHRSCLAGWLCIKNCVMKNFWKLQLKRATGLLSTRIPTANGQTLLMQDQKRITQE